MTGKLDKDSWPLSAISHHDVNISFVCFSGSLSSRWMICAIASSIYEMSEFLPFQWVLSSIFVEANETHPGAEPHAHLERSFIRIIHNPFIDYRIAS
jgi:hypothetical protein